MDTIAKTGLTQVLANVGHNGCFTNTFLDNLCLIYLKKKFNQLRNKQNKKRFINMPMILIYKICVIIGVRVCEKILLGVNTVKVEFIQVALNQN